MTGRSDPGDLLAPDRLATADGLDALLGASACDLLRAGADRGGRLVVLGDRDASVAELVEIAEQRARGLVASGLAPGDRLVLSLPSSFDLVAWTWATMFAGGVPVPVSTRSPAAEVRRFATMAGARHVVATRTGDGLLTPDEAARRWTAPESVDLPERGPGDEAACFTTSGSTGTSKLSMMTHRAFAAQAAAYQEVIGGGPGERVLHSMPLAHVASVAQVYLMLAQGREVIVLPDFDAKAVVEVVRDHRVAFASGTPAMWGLILQRTALPDSSLRLRRCSYAAAPMPTAWAKELVSALDCELVHAYGLTEAGTLTVLPPEKVIDKAGSAGHVVAPRTELAVFDVETGSRAASGQVGEVRVRGPVTSTGYVGNPEETAELLQGGWLHTGDLGRLDVDGDVWITGRIKDQINRGGLKIGAREVEEAIEAITGVVAAAVVGVADAVLGERVAAVVEVQDPTVDPDAVRAGVAQRLADYKVPQRVLCVDALPRNAMKKVDKPAVRAMLAPTQTPVR